MIERPIFVDDERVLEAVARVANAAGKLLDSICPGLAGAEGELFRRQLREHLQAKLTGKAQWVESFVVDDKTFCVYLADDESMVHEHARLSGFPASKVTEVRRVIDPMTAI